MFAASDSIPSQEVRAVQRIGIILAAGRGRRMGRTKQLVRWRTSAGEKPLVAAAFDAIAGVCDEMVVVLGHEAEAVVAALGDRAFHRVRSDPDADMLESIKVGISAAGRIDSAAWLVLQPGDHPEVAASTLKILQSFALDHPERAIMPEYRGRGGHPALIPPVVAERLVAIDCPGGLRQFWEEHPKLCCRIGVDDPRSVLDVDTPDQLSD
jgi:molybdenum cofactor cytidylyltransferase